jgi:hypothetical protein
MMRVFLDRVAFTVTAGETPAVPVRTALFGVWLKETEFEA